ncbi:MAG: phage holin family protein [Herminiimonas sp.]|nr:phage holin family protein [Herminiimonas sp.]
MAIDKSDQSLPSLLSDLTRDTVELVRQEIALVRAEMSTKISNAQIALTSVAVGAAVLMAGLFIILLAVVNAVEMLLPPEVAPWLAPLIVGIAVAIIGYMMLKGGASKLTADNLMPHKTIDSLQRDKNAVQEKM